MQRAQGEQIGIAGARADEIRESRGFFRLGGFRDRLRRAPTSASCQRPASTAAPIGPSTTRSQNRRSDRDVMTALGEALAIAAHQGGEIADARRQQRLDPLAQPARQNGRGAAGADRDHDVAAVDDGGKDEGRQVGPVDHVDRDAGRARARGDGFVHRASGGAHDGDDAGEVRRCGIARDNVELSFARVGADRGLGRSDCKLFRAGVPADAGAGRAQEPQLVVRRRSTSDQGDRSVGDIEKHGKETHANKVLLTRTIFYIELSALV